MDCKYDYVMSLGYNCEVSFKIKYFFGELDSFLYSWGFILDRELFLKSLEHMDQIFSNRIVLEPDHMMKCNLYQIKFHPRYDILPKTGDYTEENYNKALEELTNRISYLEEKTEKVLRNKRQKLLIVKVLDCGETDNIQYILHLFNKLSKLCPEGSFTLVCVLEKHAITKNVLKLEDEHLRIHSVKRFAPVKHTDIMGDVKGWYKILSKETGINNTGYWKNLRIARREIIPAMIINKMKKIINNALIKSRKKKELNIIL